MDKIYDRQNTDTDKSFAAFAIYRDMGSDRTLEKVRVEIGHRSVRNLEAWCSKHQWVARCRAFDDDELHNQSISLQNQRTKYRLEMEKDAWERRKKFLAKADKLLSIPITKKIESEDGKTIFMPTNKWRLVDAIAFYQYSDRLGIFATGGETKKIDELEAVQLLADLGIIPLEAVVAIGQGYERFKEVIREAL